MPSTIINPKQAQSKTEPQTSEDIPTIVREHRRGLLAIDFEELLHYKDLFYFLVFRDIKVLYKQTILGFGWAILRPFFSMIVFSFVFGRLANVPSDGIPYPIFSYAALVPWTYFQNSLTKSTQSLIQGANLFTKVYFPRIFIPMTPVVAGLVDFVIALGMLGVLMIWYGVYPNLNILFVPLMVLLMVLTASGAGMWLSVLGVQYRDVRFAIQFVTQLLMYAAPVVWPASLIGEKFGPTARILYGFYPMAGVIEGFRSALLGHNPMPWDLLVTGAISSLLIFLFGFMHFRRTERYLADVA